MKIKTFHVKINSVRENQNFKKKKEVNFGVSYLMFWPFDLSTLLVYFWFHSWVQVISQLAKLNCGDIL